MAEKKEAKYRMSKGNVFFRADCLGCGELLWRPKTPVTHSQMIAELSAAVRVHFLFCSAMER